MGIPPPRTGIVWGLRRCADPGRQHRSVRTYSACNAPSRSIDVQALPHRRALPAWPVRPAAHGVRRAEPAGQRRVAEGAERLALPQRPEPAVRAARALSLVLGRRHAACLPRGKRPRVLSQPLGAHTEVGAGTCRRRRPVRRLRQPALLRPAHRQARLDRGQHQRGLACRPLAGAGRGACAFRGGPGDAGAQGLPRLRRQAGRPDDGAPQDGCEQR